MHWNRYIVIFDSVHRKFQFLTLLSLGSKKFEEVKL